MESIDAKVGDTVIARHNVGPNHRDKPLYIRRDERATILAIRTDSGGQYILCGKQG